jgi:hypothetical protein
MGFIVKCTKKTSALTQHCEQEALLAFDVALLAPEAYETGLEAKSQAGLLNPAKSSLPAAKEEVLLRAYQHYQQWNEQLLQLTHCVAALLGAEPADNAMSSIFVEPLRHQCRHWQQTPGALFYPLETDFMVLQLADSLLLPLTFEAASLQLNQYSALSFALLQKDLHQLQHWKTQLEQRLQHIDDTLRLQQVAAANQLASQLRHVNNRVLQNIAALNRV